MNETDEQPDARAQLPWYARRVAALEKMLAHYRLGTAPTETLHRELELTRQFISSKGYWVKRDQTT